MAPRSIRKALTVMKSLNGLPMKHPQRRIPRLTNREPLSIKSAEPELDADHGLSLGIIGDGGAPSTKSPSRSYGCFELCSRLASSASSKGGVELKTGGQKRKDNLPNGITRADAGVSPMSLSRHPMDHALRRALMAPRNGRSPSSALSAIRLYTSILFLT
jgi:hypothetical protein